MRLTDETLSQILHGKSCYIDPDQDRIGYITNIRSMRYARRLLNQWHGKNQDGQKLQCQIELEPSSSVSERLSRSDSTLNLKKRDDTSRRFTSNYLKSNNSAKSSRNSSVSREDSDSQIRILNEKEFNHEGRLFSQSIGNINKQRDAETKNKGTSLEAVFSSVQRKRTYTVI